MHGKCDLCNQYADTKDMYLFRVKEKRLFSVESRNWENTAGTRHLCRQCVSVVGDSIVWHAYCGEIVERNDPPSKLDMDDCWYVVSGDGKKFVYSVLRDEFNDIWPSMHEGIYVTSDQNLSMLFANREDADLVARKMTWKCGCGACSSDYVVKKRERRS